ncbi:hypothetical protein HFP15_10540 [Amycolatopsis sp. K13G38]|uniref:Uncharacterized protein n=1 Tax=Amycolatopsis acididurans TaxID=2724524 RepID=A0ABX1J2X4_9PSEU|nr:hypothetical protein [Amycolatopsis acididurans]NKQ53319.1 hypothetical protein [Amycolatopsis acididurans]
MTRTQRDLFGNTITAADQASGRRITNDMSLVEKVLEVAELEGYVLVGVAEKVYRKESKNQITATTADEAHMVHQLLDTNWLTKGGVHTYQCGGREGPGNSVLVPRKSKEKARQWRALAPIAGKDARHAVADDQRAG